MPHPLLTASNTFNRSAIMSRAWSKAKASFVSCKRLGIGRTLRECFASDLRFVWDEARGARALAIWSAEQDAGAPAEKARREALPVRERQIEDAQTALILAEHSDAFGSYAAIAAAHARLHSLQHAA